MTNRYAFAILACFSAMLFLPARAPAQGVHIDVAPRFVAYVPTSDLDGVAPAGDPWYLKLGQADAAGALEVESRLLWPSGRFAFRVFGLATLPADVSGIFDCYPGLACPAVLLRSNAEMVVLAAAVDVQYSPRHPGSAVRPYASFGVGVKRYRFSWPDADVIVLAGDHADTSPAVRAGFGVEFNFRGQSIRAEVADWWTDEGDEIRTLPGTASQLAPRRRAQHDIAVSIGWRLLSF